MNIDMERLLRDHGVAIADKSDKHCRPGWVNVDCPFCADKKKHLGWSVKKQRFNCYKCGAHGTDDTIAELLAVSDGEAWVLKRRYALRPGALVTKEDTPIVRPERVVVPGFDIPSADAVMHGRYLEGRGYDVDKIGPLWGLRGTGPLSRGHEKFRVFCPIYHDGRVVSWQGRDVTGRSDLRWYSCPAEFELREHKHCLGGEQLVPGDSVAVVEGFTDAWRLGPGAVCTFGTDYLTAQVNLLRRYRRRFIVLDSEDKDPNARRQADLLANQLSAFAGETVMVELDSGDPGDLAQDDADHLMEREWRVR